MDSLWCHETSKSNGLDIFSDKFNHDIEQICVTLLEGLFHVELKRLMNHVYIFLT